MLSNFPNLSKEWNIEKNYPLKPEYFTSFSEKKIWWTCSNGHDWYTSISTRTSNQSGCPYCSGRFVSKENNLAVLYPDVASEWHPLKNNETTPDQVASKSNKLFWWLCKNNHEWNCSVIDRTGKNTGCPYCSGRRVSVTRNLKHFYPEIAKEWHPTKNGDKKPEEFAPMSSKKVWWSCPKGHAYDALISNRTSRKSGCSYCSGKKVGKDNNLKIKFPKIAKEWHPIKNEGKNP